MHTRNLDIIVKASFLSHSIHKIQPVDKTLAFELKVYYSEETKISATYLTQY